MLKVLTKVTELDNLELGYEAQQPGSGAYAPKYGICPHHSMETAITNLVTCLLWNVVKFPAVCGSWMRNYIFTAPEKTRLSNALQLSF